MTFKFRTFPFSRDNVRPVRPRLIARWHREADGKLVCRWEAQPIPPLSD